MSERVDVRIVSADAIKVGPDEVLIVQLPQDSPAVVFEGLTEALEQLGLGGRSLVLGLDAPLAVVQRTVGNNDHEDDGA